MGDPYLTPISYFFCKQTLKNLSKNFQVKLKIFITIGIFLSLFSPFSYGDTTPEIQWLMKEPVNLFDWGLNRVSQEVKTEIDFYTRPEVGIKLLSLSKGIFLKRIEASYKKNTNTIILHASFFDVGRFDTCQSIIISLKKLLNLDEIYTIAFGSSINNPSRPKDLIKKLAGC